MMPPSRSVPGPGGDRTLRQGSPRTLKHNGHTLSATCGCGRGRRLTRNTVIGAPYFPRMAAVSHGATGSDAHPAYVITAFR